MNKQEFMTRLTQGLSGLPRDTVEECLGFYSEMIDDRMEEGLTEEEAVSRMDPPEEIARQTLQEVPLTKLVKEKLKPVRKYSGWEILFFALGFPIWLPLLAVAFALVLVVYAVLWALVVCLWAVEFAFGVSGPVCAAGGIVWMCISNQPADGLILLGGGMVLMALAVFLFFGCKGATKGSARLTRTIALSVKKLFVRKEVRG